LREKSWLLRGLSKPSSFPLPIFVPTAMLTARLAPHFSKIMKKQKLNPTPNMKLLHIIATTRGENSRTLSISREFLRELKDKHPDVQVDELDLSTTVLPPVLDTNVNAKYIMMMGGQLDEQTQASWKKVTELAEHFISYDLFLITAPMWNFSIPYMLKHYIDVIMQAGILFSFTAHGPQGLMKYEKMVCITSRGSDYSPGSPIHELDFQEPYLRAIFGLAGIEEIHFVHAQPMDMAPGLTQDALEKAREEARQMVGKLAVGVESFRQLN
jgi:FMN-dependent NADH-azoreductase